MALAMGKGGPVSCADNSNRTVVVTHSTASEGPKACYERSVFDRMLIANLCPQESWTVGILELEEVWIAQFNLEQSDRLKVPWKSVPYPGLDTRSLTVLVRAVPCGAGWSSLVSLAVTMSGELVLRGVCTKLLGRDLSSSKILEPWDCFPLIVLSCLTSSKARVRTAG